MNEASAVTAFVEVYYRRDKLPAINLYSYFLLICDARFSHKGWQKHVLIFTGGKLLRCSQALLFHYIVTTYTNFYQCQ